MNLYQWRSKELKAYAEGYIITAASNIAEARSQARTEFELWLTENHDWEDPDDLAERRRNFDGDLAVHPEIRPLPAAVLIRGSS